MDAFQKIADERTAKKENGLLCVTAGFVNKDGAKIFTSGSRGLSSDAPAMTEDSIIRLASASKVITTVAALQCVERGLVYLDEPLTSHLPELAKQEIITPNTGDDKDSIPFIYSKPKNAITLRMLLTHTSGVGYDVAPPLIDWRKSRGEEPMATGAVVMEAYTTPLIFEPGTSWSYGAGIDWAGILVSRLTGLSLEDYMQKNIFDPLGMASTTFFVEGKKDLLERLVSSVNRTEGKLVEVPPPNKDAAKEEAGGGGLYSTTQDLLKFFGDLVAPEPKLLGKEMIEKGVFAAQIPPGSGPATGLEPMLGMFAVMVSSFTKGADVRQTLGGMLLVTDSDDFKNSKGSITWFGATGCMWLANRDRGFAAFYGGQVYPPPDEINGESMKSFLDCFWELNERS